MGSSLSTRGLQPRPKEPGTLVLATKGAVEKLAGSDYGFYAVCTSSVVLGGLWLYLMQGRVRALQARPHLDWLSSADDDAAHSTKAAKVRRL